MLNRGGGSAKPLSTAWRRLRPTHDLGGIGLPSKGDKRLLDHQTQERYYARIIGRYIEFVADAGECKELLRRLEDLDIAATLPAPVPPDNNEDNKQEHIAEILFSLRKLREGIVATSRVDMFACVVYVFCIKLAIMAKHPQSYYPALLHVQRRFLPRGLLSALEASDMATYLVLDAACRKRNLAEAYSLRDKLCTGTDDRLDAILSALAHDNYVSFRREKRIADGYRAKLMDHAEDDMRLVTLKTFGRAYMSVDLLYLEKCTNQSWAELKKGGVGWELNGEDKVMIRKPRSVNPKAS